MKKILFLLMLFCFFSSCERKEPNFSEEMIEKLVFKDDGLPPYYLGLDLYVITNNNEIHQTNNNELMFFYKKYYSKKFKSFNQFLDAGLNNNFVFDKKLFKEKSYYLESFKLNSKIEKEYSDLGFEEFLKKYSKETTAKRLALNRATIKDGEYLTIAYFLYKNKYDISSDCYLAIDYLRKREDSFK
jgi:Xaa-Pro aminopeptidase